MQEVILIVEDEFIVAEDLTNLLQKAGHVVCAVEDTVEGAKRAIDAYAPTWVLLDIFLQDDIMGTELAPYLHARDIGFIYISANTNQTVLEAAKATQPFGFLVKPFREKDLLLMLDIARNKHESIEQFSAQREALLQQGLRSLTDDKTPYQNKLEKTPAAFQSLIPFDYLVYSVAITSHDVASQRAFCRIGFNEYQLLPAEETQLVTECMAGSTPAEAQATTASTTILSGDQLRSLLAKKLGGNNHLSTYNVLSALQFIHAKSGGLLRLCFFSKREDTYNRSHERLLSKSESAVFRLFNQLSEGVEGRKDPVLKREGSVLSRQPKPKFEGIIGNSAALLNVLDNVEMVAGTNVTVLITGESGTGKEQIAQHIHHSSPRKTKPFVIINCATLPSELAESELFGHEKGAFTGASERRIGKFEAANAGTIFLDEIGELPLQSQVKLLRVLQEKQLERVGSSTTINIDVRVIAATNRNLEKEVAEGRFRLDLFYRLSVYPIVLPPLRDREEDVLLLADYFMEQSAAHLGRAAVPALSPAALKQLTGYNWPGNIRELQHLIERTLIKQKGNVIENLEMPASAGGPAGFSTMPNANKTLQQIETEHILSVLKKCNGRVNGVGGAAEILGLPASTLTSKMKKLGIKKSMNFGR